MIYLAQPYTHSDPAVVETRYHAALLWFAHFESRYPYSPIVQWHNIAREHSLPTDAQYWLGQNYHFLDRSKALYVLTLEGWQESYGLAKEIIHAANKGLPLAQVAVDSGDVWYVTPSTLLKDMKYGPNITQRESYPRAVKGDDT